MRRKAVRRAARASDMAQATEFGSNGGAEPSSMTELDVGGTRVTVFGAAGPQAILVDAMRSAVARSQAARSNAAAENQKTEVPCHGCGRLMPAAERCAGCRASGVWYCDAYHARFEGELEGGFE